MLGKILLSALAAGLVVVGCVAVTDKPELEEREREVYVTPEYEDEDGVLENEAEEALEELQETTEEVKEEAELKFEEKRKEEYYGPDLKEKI